jgi:hypothetical protein
MVAHMACYRVHGGCLRSEVEFPELPLGEPGRSEWTLRVAEELPLLSDASFLGEEPLIDGVTARLQRGANSFRLTFEDTGTFDVSPDGSVIFWKPAPDSPSSAPLELVRADVTGRVLALAIHAAGGMCLHASSVAVGGSAIAFLGAKGRGKTTLALAMVADGARLLSDDTLRVDLTLPPQAAPGLPTMRVANDVADRFDRRALTTPEGDGGTKLALSGLAPHELMTTRAPLSAIYVLSPVQAEEGRPAVRRRELTSVEAALTLVHHAKLATLLGRGEAPALLMRAGSLASSVPVYALDVSRDLSRAAEVARQIARWHSAPALATEQ